MTPTCLGRISLTAAADTDLVTMTTTRLALKYLENSWRCYLTAIANYSIVCYEAVLSATCLLAAESANRPLFRYEFLNLFSYLFKMKLLHFRVSKTKFRFSTHCGRNPRQVPS